MTTITMQGDKVVMRDGKVATGQECCCKSCCCESITLNDLLYGNKSYSWSSIKPPGKREPQSGVVGDPPESQAGNCTDPKQANDVGTNLACCNEVQPGVFEWVCDGRWQVRAACLRWLCRCVDENGNVLCSQTYGGPTINNVDLTELAMDEFGVETAAGCYVYTFEFFGWRRKRARRGTQPADWQGRDDIYTAYKTEVYC